MNCPETNNNFFDPPHSGGGGVPRGIGGGGGQNFKSPGNVMNCRENRYIVVYLTHPPRLPNLWGGGG